MFGRTHRLHGSLCSAAPGILIGSAEGEAASSRGGRQVAGDRSGPPDPITVHGGGMVSVARRFAARANEQTRQNPQISGATPEGEYDQNFRLKLPRLFLAPEVVRSAPCAVGSPRASRISKELCESVAAPLIAPVLYSFRRRAKTSQSAPKDSRRSRSGPRPTSNSKRSTACWGAAPIHSFASVGFHLRHIAGTVDQLNTYLEGKQGSRRLRFL